MRLQRAPVGARAAVFAACYGRYRRYACCRGDGRYACCCDGRYACCCCDGRYGVPRDALP